MGSAMNKIGLVLILAGPLAWSLTSPAQLTVVSATNRQVQLSWAPAGTETDEYIVERRALDSATFIRAAILVPDINKALATAFIDTNFDAFTPYVYRVRAVNTALNPPDVSDPTREVTVGPPPYGYTRVAATPDKLDSPAQFGANTQIVLDRSGDPMLSYLNLDPNLDLDYSDTEIRFVRWDRAHYTWTAPVVVALSDIDSSLPSNYSFRLAMDASTGALGIVYVDNTGLPTNQISLADSTDNGLTWRKRKVVSGRDPYYVPALALGTGRIHLTFAEAFVGVRYVTGTMTDNSMSWSIETVPSLGFPEYGFGSDIALDSEGKPAIAYLLLGDDFREIFYRPGSAPSVANVSMLSPGDDSQLRLAFAGTKPRIAFAGRLDSHYFEDYDHTLFVLTSPDSGTTWNPRVNIKSDGNRAIGGPIDFAFSSNGTGALTSHDDGGNYGGEVCGYPKLSLSSDLQSWTTCGITTTIRSRENSSGVRFAFNDTLYLTISVGQYPFDPNDPKEVAAGLYFWRGPVGFQLPTGPPPQ